MNRVLLLALATVTLGACRAGERPGSRENGGASTLSVTAAPVAPSDGRAAAERAVAAYLHAAEITRLDSTHIVPDSLFACDEDGAPDPGFYLAHGTVLESRVTGDTVMVRSEVIIVGQSRQSPTEANAEIIAQRVRTDTVEWTVLRRPGGGWGLCGGPSTGGGILRMGAGPAVTWRPASASWATLAALADSVQRTAR